MLIIKNQVSIMDINKIPSFSNKLCNEVNAIIEIPQHQIGLKYEIDKESGALFVDRFLTAPMFYPANYGFIPNTLADDKDPLDILVIAPFAIQAGAVIPARPIGVLMMEDEKGMDEKIIAVPTSSVCKDYDDIKEIEDLPQNLVAQIKQFFERYKELESEKWVKVNKFKNTEEALKLISGYAK
jgi:inorganic pyrophosphatase